VTQRKYFAGPSRDRFITAVTGAGGVMRKNDRRNSISLPMHKHDTVPQESISPLSFQQFCWLLARKLCQECRLQSFYCLPTCALLSSVSLAPYVSSSILL